MAKAGKGPNGTLPLYGVNVYVPAGYVAGTPLPFMVDQDGPNAWLFAALDNLIAQRRVPPMAVVSIGNGGGDAQGSERGLEYDTLSDRYERFVETEVLPRASARAAARPRRDRGGARRTAHPGGARGAGHHDGPPDGERSAPRHRRAERPGRACRRCRRSACRA